MRELLEAHERFVVNARMAQIEPRQCPEFEQPRDVVVGNHTIFPIHEIDDFECFVGRMSEKTALPAGSTTNCSYGSAMVFDRLNCGNSPIKSQADWQKHGKSEQGDGGQPDPQQPRPPY